MKPLVITVGPLAAASANNILTSITPTSGTTLTLNGSTVTAGVAILDKPRRVIVTAGSEGSQRTILLTGTDRFSVPQSETITIPASSAGAVSSVLDYKTVTAALPAGGGWTAGATIGTNAIASSQWAYMDGWAFPQTSLQSDASGTVNYTWQQSLDDPLSPTNPVTPVNMVWIDHPDTNLVGATASKQGNYAYIPQWIRINLNSGTGTVTGTIIQSANVPM